MIHECLSCAEKPPETLKTFSNLRSHPWTVNFMLIWWLVKVESVSHCTKIRKAWDIIGKHWKEPESSYGPNFLNCFSTLCDTVLYSAVVKYSQNWNLDSILKGHFWRKNYLIVCKTSEKHRFYSQMQRFCKILSSFDLCRYQFWL